MQMLSYIPDTLRAGAKICGPLTKLFVMPLIPKIDLLSIVIV
jgi:hypothetical protein